MQPFNWQEFADPVIGLDEVGRGCLAGPVYAAAVLLNRQFDFDQYVDSKSVSENRREALAKDIETNHKSAIGIASPAEIDQYNIHKASLLAMKRALIKLNLRGGLLLVDGKFAIPGLTKLWRQIPLVKGDQRAHPISAASIVAKVARDQLMKAWGKKWPHYGFEIHKGYPTPLHLEAIRKYGPIEHHRKTFKGVREFCLQETQGELL